MYGVRIANVRPIHHPDPKAYGKGIRKACCSSDYCRRLVEAMISLAVTLVERNSTTPIVGSLNSRSPETKDTLDNNYINDVILQWSNDTGYPFWRECSPDRGLRCQTTPFLFWLFKREAADLVLYIEASRSLGVGETALSPQRDGMAESFETIKRDYVAHMPKPNRKTRSPLKLILLPSA